MLRKQSGDPSLVSLVKTFSGDIPSNQVIEEMIRVKAIERTVRGHFKPLSIDYAPLPISESPEYLMRLGRVWTDFGRTVVHNLYREQDDIGRFEKRVYEYIPTEKVKEFERFTRILNNALLESTNVWLESNRISEKSSNGVRTGVGVYSFVGKNDD